MRRQLPLQKKILASLIRTAIITTALAPVISWAQSSDANLRGKAQPSAVVTAKNVATGAVRRTTAAADGSYSLVGLQPGTYTVDAGPGTEQTVTLTVASNASLDLAANAAPPTGPATTLEGVSVTATTLTDVKSPEVGQTISLHQIETIPQVTRNFLEFADTVPGMIFTVDNSGHTKLQGGAQSANSVNVYIDGVGQKNYVKEGGVAGQFSSQGNPFPQLAIGEYKVITSNYKAEFDQIASAAVTADTKSGTNEFHGETYGEYTDQDFRSNTPTETAAGKKTPSQEKEYGFALGGPIIKDQMHFFFTYEAKQYDTPISVTPGTVNGVDNIVSLLPADVQSQFGPAGLPFVEHLYFGKIDWELTDRDRIDLSGKVRRENQADGIGPAEAQSSSVLVANNDTRVDLRWQHSADLWTNEALVTYEKTFNAPQSFGFGNGSVYTYHQGTQDTNIIDVGPASPLSTQNKGQKGPGFQDDLTFNNFNWYGDHTVKLGVKAKSVKLTAADASDVNPQFYYDVTQNGTATIPYKVFFTNPVPGLNPTATSRDNQYGSYIQDDWAINDKLTLNLGVRYDVEDNQGYRKYVTPDNVIAALNAQDPNAPTGQTYAQTLAKGGINVNDYISNGHNRGKFDGEWQPRLGFSYDFGGDEQHVLHGGAGRSYDRDLYDYLQVEETKAALPQFTIFFPNDLHACGAGSQCVPFNPVYMQGLQNLQALVSSSNAGQEVDMLNNNLKAPYSDQFSLGIRNKVGDWNTDATVARIVSKDGFAFTLGNRYPDGGFFESCGVNCQSQPWGNGVPGFGSLIVGNNGIETRNTSLLLSADKPYTKESGWSATFAYTYSRAKQNRDINEHYSFDEPTIQDYPFIDSNAVPKHRFVATGAWDGPAGFTFSGKLTLATPTPRNDVPCLPDGVSGTLLNNARCEPMAGTVSGGYSGTDSNATGAQRFITGGKIWGFREIDLAINKDFDLTAGVSAYIRLDALNIFNYHNYSDYDTSYFASNGTLNKYPVAYQQFGNIFLPPREVKVTLGFRF
jgi:outer membrane receptor protein involved in Fe transport